MQSWDWVSPCQNQAKPKLSRFNLELN